MRICGIDPGSNGAICVLDRTDSTYIAFCDLNKSTTYDITIWLFNQKVTYIWIEDVHSLYGMSARSNFIFGKNLGIVTTISEILSKGDSSKIRTVTPKIWQRHIGVTKKGKHIKKNIADIAKKLYPNANIHGKRGGLLDGRSDACMVAYYGLTH